MRLIDTNVLLCHAIRPDRLPKKLQRELLNSTEAFAYSDISLWEIAIKSSLGKSDFHVDPQPIEHELNRQGFTQIPITSSHIFRTMQLPLHHKDPFDRLIVAQSLVLNIPLLTSDAKLTFYGDQIVHIKLSI